MDAHPDAVTSQLEPPAAPARRQRRRSPRLADEAPADAAPAAASAVDEDAAVDSEPGPVAAWFRSRPTIGGLITVLGGVAMFFSSQLQLGGMTVHVGIEGAQAMILPTVLIVCGALAIFSPAQHVFYGIVAMIISVYSLVGVNLGGFFIGFLLGSVGGVVVTSWRRKDSRADDGAVEPEPALDVPAPALAELAPAGERE